MTLILDDSLYSKVAHFVSVVAGENVVIETNANSIKNVVLPAFIPSDKTDMFVTCGLCNVVRQIIKHSVKLLNHSKEKDEMEMYLGYKQNCLKGCAAISSWTNFCEKDFPSAVCKLIKKICDNDVLILPKEIIQLEKEFTVPKKTANAMKHHLAGRGYQVHAASPIDINMIRNVMKEINLVVDCDACTNIYGSCEPIISSCEEVMKRKNQIFWPYLCGFDCTIADLLILGFVVELLFNMSCICFVKDFFISFPNIFRWFSLCLTKSSILNAVSKIWSTSCYQKCPNIPSPLFSSEQDLESIHHVSFDKKSYNTKQMHSKITKNLPCILTKIAENEIEPCFETDCQVDSITWSKYPAEVNPVEGELNSARALRKRQQIENMVYHISPLLKSGDKMVDFCAGGGHLGIVIAYLRPDCNIILLENKEESIDRALSRIRKLGLSNVSLRLSNLEYFDGDFNVGVALHACGSATDLVLQKCLKYNASFIICPCCYGGIKSSDMLTYPQSKTYMDVEEKDFMILCHSADQTCSDFDSDYSKQGKNCMLLVDYDRVMKAKDVGNYQTFIFSMIPESCSPKNNIIVGKIVDV